MQNQGSLQSKRVLIHPHQTEQFSKRLAALNAKAEKFGLKPIKASPPKETLWQWRTEKVSEGKDFTYLHPVSDDQIANGESFVSLNSIQLDFPIIKLGDWQVVGKLEAIENGNLQFSITDSQEDRAHLMSIAAKPICCEHCNVKRQRNDGFLLRNQDGQYKQVGSTCLEDFTGIDPSSALFLAQMSALIKSCEEEIENGPRTPTMLSTAIFLANVCKEVQKHGYLSRTKASERGLVSTSDKALQNSLENKNSLEDKHYEKAKKIIEWSKGLDPQNTFSNNMKLLLSTPFIRIAPKYMGIAAAAVPQYDRAMSQKITRENSSYIGTPGDKLKACLTINNIHTFTTQFGPSTIVTFSDSSGNILKWKTASCPQDVRDGQGRTFDGQFKVKEHSDWQGIKQTTVTHLKVLNWHEPEPAPEQEQEPEPALEDQQLFNVVTRIDEAAIVADWPGFLPPKSFEHMKILKDYAEEALQSDQPEKDQYFTEQLHITPHEFYVHHDYLSDLYNRYLERSRDTPSSSVSLAPRPCAAPQAPESDNNPAPF